MRRTALLAAGAGAVGSVGLMLQSGQRNSSIVMLVIMFAVWVLSPFVGLVWAIGVSHRWSARTRSALYYLTIFIALASVGLYAVRVLEPARIIRGAAIFLIVPLASWLLMALVPIIERNSKR